MQIPPGTTEAAVLATIETITTSLAKKYAFPGYDPDDIAQEARLMALDALSRYDPEVGPLENFLFSHVKRRLLNFKRDHYKRCDPPCLACHRCDQEGGRPEHHDDGDFCVAYRNWRGRNDSRVNLTTAREVNLNDFRRATLDDASTDVEVEEILTLLNRELTVEDRKIWLMLRQGCRGIPGEKRKRVEATIKRILEEAGVELRSPWA